MTKVVNISDKFHLKTQVHSTKLDNFRTKFTTVHLDSNQISINIRYTLFVLRQAPV